MCGITGVLELQERPVPPPVVAAMAARLAHRGPDGEGVWTEGPIGLGHRRLAIIDLSPLGRQPMQSDDGSLVIVYNGEVYNFPQLRMELEAKGYQFHSKTDSEVVLKAYHAWGPGAVERLNGMFAFAIWDARRRELFLARDRYGIKPLYYALRDGTFLFGSEIKAILAHPVMSVRVSLFALNEYFSFQNVLSDLTLFEGVRLLQPGHTLRVRLGAEATPSPEQYWNFRFCDDEIIEEQEAVEELDRLFEQAVSRQLISDVEIGAYLSGGMDSGSVTCLAARNFRNLKTFTCGFDLSSASGLELGFDERAKAEFLSNLYKTEHYEVVLKAGDMERVMPALVWHLEDLRVGQSYPNYYVARLASKFVKVVLSGAGGDELFGGYPWRYYRAVVNLDRDEYVEKYYRYWQRLIPDRVKAEFFVPPVARALDGHRTLDVFRGVFPSDGAPVSSPADYVNTSLYFEIKTFLHGLLVVEDKLSMAHSLETRVPFLDNDLVDFAMRVPVRYKLRDLEHVVRLNENEPGLKAEKYFRQTNDGKMILRRALMRYVPGDYANGIKQGFSAPDASWFKGESIDYIRQLLMDRRARIHDFIEPRTSQALMEEHLRGETNRRLLIWSLLCFEWWLRTFDPVPASG